MYSNGTKILLRRRESNVNQESLARALGLNASSIIDIENNRIEVTDETCEKIIAAINELAAKSTAA